MSEDRSLDEFAGGSDAESDAGDDGIGGGEPDECEESDGGKANAVDDPEPATTTSAWTGEGAACDACGTVTERRWQDDGELVCADCKSW